MSSVSVIIPVLNAESMLPALLDLLHRQTVRPQEILVADSRSTDYTADIVRQDPLARLIAVESGTFDHGGTRHAAFLESRGDFVCFLTQDAVPVDETMIEKLLAPLADPNVGCAYGRQIARRDADAVEQLTRKFNYPSVSAVNTLSTLPQKGVRAVFFSNVCSIYRRSAYEAVGGFERPILTNEDMLIAVRMLRHGFQTAYAADACVVHSHHFTMMEEFHRYFDIGAFLRMHRAELRSLHLSGEGIRFMKSVSGRLLAGGHIGLLFSFFVHCGFRLAGRLLGGAYPLLSKKWILQITGNPSYWRNSA